jgi:hypothetical protein
MAEGRSNAGIASQLWGSTASKREPAVSSLRN